MSCATRSPYGTGPHEGTRIPSEPCDDLEFVLDMSVEELKEFVVDGHTLLTSHATCSVIQSTEKM